LLFLTAHITCIVVINVYEEDSHVEEPAAAIAPH
jgi:hypothetical protein